MGIQLKDVAIIAGIGIAAFIGWKLYSAFKGPAEAIGGVISSGVEGVTAVSTQLEGAKKASLLMLEAVPSGVITPTLTAMKAAAIDIPLALVTGTKAPIGHIAITSKTIAAQIRVVGYKERNPFAATVPVKTSPIAAITYQPVTKSLHGLINPKTGFRYSGR